MRDVALALGSNMGESALILQGAIDDLAVLDGLELSRVSPVYETDPVGGPEQQPYLNAVVVGRTSLAPHDLLAATHSVEEAWHRVRLVHWGPRTLDVDILAMGDTTVDSPDLVVPHPRAHERGFVLVPWADVDPDFHIPGHGSVSATLAHVGSNGVRPTDIVLRLPEGGAP
jgi:2-amino-4-hydroxy-6-hydroxymethyldihydropteridine diphosphokinase